MLLRPTTRDAEGEVADRVMQSCMDTETPLYFIRGDLIQMEQRVSLMVVARHISKGQAQGYGGILHGY